MRLSPLLALTAFLIAVTPALAEPLARVSGSATVRTGPGLHYRSIGALPDGAEVKLDYCTGNDRWCHVADTGWVDASFIVGWAAKIPVTPFRFSTDPTDDGDWF